MWQRYIMAKYLGKRSAYPVFREKYYEGSAGCNNPTDIKEQAVTYSGSRFSLLKFFIAWITEMNFRKRAWYAFVRDAAAQALNDVTSPVLTFILESHKAWTIWSASPWTLSCFHSFMQKPRSYLTVMAGLSFTFQSITLSPDCFLATGKTM